MAESKLLQAARKAVALAKPKAGERFLIVTDPPTMIIGLSLFVAASKACKASLLVMEPTGRSGIEPPKGIAKAMQQADIVYCATKYSLTHTNATRAAKKRGARVVTLPGITGDVLVRGMRADYKKIRKTNAKLEKLMKDAKEIRVEAWRTEFTVKRGSRRFCTDDADIKSGNVYNLPGGETGFAPVDFNGVFTGTSGEMKNKTFTVKNNTVVNVSDAKLKKEIWGIRNARKIAEFAIGTNPGARLSGSVLEDEKVLGTCHVAIGDSKSLGGTTDARIHWDFIIRKPSIWFGKKRVMSSGKLF